MLYWKSILSLNVTYFAYHILQIRYRSSFTIFFRIKQNVEYLIAIFFFHFFPPLPVSESVIFRKSCQLGILNSSMNDQIRPSRLQVRSRSMSMGAYDFDDNEFSEEYLNFFMLFKVKIDQKFRTFINVHSFKYIAMNFLIQCYDGKFMET